MKQNLRSFITVSEKYSLFHRVVSSLLVILLVACSSTVMLFAETESESDTVVIDGITYDYIELSADDIVNMYQSGDIDLYCGFLPQRSEHTIFGNLYNMRNHTTQSMGGSSSSPFVVDYLPSVEKYDDNNVVFFYPYTLNSTFDSTYSIDYLFRISIPFSAYFYNSNFIFSSWMCNNTTSTGIVQFSKDDIIVGTTLSQTSTPSRINWSDNSYLTWWYNKYEWLPNGQQFSSIKAQYSAFSITSSSVPQEFDTFYLGFKYFPASSSLVYSPIAVVVQFPIRFLVLHDSAPLIEEYLGLIASNTPSSGQQQRINELRQAFSDSQSTMDDIVDDIHVDMPDLPDVSALPDEAVEGMEKIVPYISEVFNFSTITIILSSVFIFTAIKLLLYGSGSS